MSILYGNHDRAKASEHALFLVRELLAPAPQVAAALTGAAKRRTDLSVTHSASDWLIVIRDPAAECDVFEGVIRFERETPDVTQATLLGRFIAPRAVGDDTARTRAYDEAENAVVAAFESLLAEIAAAIADEARLVGVR